MSGQGTPGDRDDFDDYLEEQMRSPSFAEAYELARRRHPWRMAGGTVEYALARLGARVLRTAPWLARIGP